MRITVIIGKRVDKAGKEQWETITGASPDIDAQCAIYNQIIARNGEVDTTGKNGKTYTRKYEEIYMLDSNRPYRRRRFGAVELVFTLDGTK